MKILVVDDHALCRTGMRFMLTGLFPEATVLEAANAHSAQSILQQHPDLDLCLVDLSLPGESGMDLVSSFNDQFPGIACIVVSANKDTATILEAMRRGARGYIPKTLPQAITENAINLVMAGDRYLPAHLLHAHVARPLTKPSTHAGLQEPLTPRQHAVLQCLLQGLPTKTISRQLSLSENTIKTHLAAIYRQFNVNTRSQAVIAASRLGISHIGN